MTESIVRNRRLFIHIISIVVGVILLVGIGLHVGIGRVLSNLSALDPLILVPLVTVYTVSWLFRGDRFRRILSLLGSGTGFRESLGIELIGDLANQVIPAKLGDAVKVVYMKRKGILGYTAGTFAAFMVRLLDLAAVIILALFSVVFISGAVAADYLAYTAVMALVIVLIAAAVWIFVMHPVVFSGVLIGPLRRMRPSVIRFAELMRSNPGRLALILLESMFVWVFDILTLFIFLVAFGVRLSFPETAFVLLFSNLMKIIPLTPNGLGVYEGAMVVLLGSFGVSGSAAFSIGVLDHGFMNFYSLLLGVVAVYGMGLGFAGLRKLAPEGKFNRSDTA